ncbi:neuropeptides capa receptor-like [Choristoneura fumiferana]|uniref:neuropeptides capa receptor-like n=1 Tax=Choristoneura fumiferana TaxID=7141 RepID=UPI003D15E6A3
MLLTSGNVDDYCKYCLGRTFNITLCSENDFVDCYMYPKRMFDFEYLVPVTVLLICIFLSGLIGNLSVCTVIARHPVLRSETNAYLFSLAVSDLFLLVFGLPHELWSYWHRYPYIFGDFLCRFVPFMTATGTYSSVLTIVAFSVERYEAICHPLRIRSRSVKRVVIALCAAWTISAAAALPILHVYNIEQRVTAYPTEAGPNNPDLSTVCYVPNESKYKYYDNFYIGSSVVFFFIPMAILLLAYTKIAIFIRKNRQLSRNCGILNSCSENRKTFKMLAAVVLAFFACGAPYHYQRVFTPRVKPPEVMAYYRKVTVVTGIFYYFSATVNPILYNVMSKRYRKAFMDIFWTKNGSHQSTATPAMRIKFSGKSTTQTLLN